MSNLKTLYDEDFAAWSTQQAEALRAAARTGSNQLLDWLNLAEEIEDLSRREQRELSGRLAVIIEHLVKLTHSPALDPRNAWRRTIRQERAQIERILEQSPSLKRKVPRMIGRETRRAAGAAIAELADRHELTGPLRDALKAKSDREPFTYTKGQILGDWFPPGPEGERLGHRIEEP